MATPQKKYWIEKILDYYLDNWKGQMKIADELRQENIKLRARIAELESGKKAADGIRYVPIGDCQGSEKILK